MVRKVASADGVRRYKLPIGTPLDGSNAVGEVAEHVKNNDYVKPTTDKDNVVAKLDFDTAKRTAKPKLDAIKAKADDYAAPQKPSSTAKTKLDAIPDEKKAAAKASEYDPPVKTHSTETKPTPSEASADPWAAPAKKTSTPEPAPKAAEPEADPWAAPAKESSAPKPAESEADPWAAPGKSTAPAAEMKFVTDSFGKSQYIVTPDGKTLGLDMKPVTIATPEQLKSFEPIEGVWSQTYYADYSGMKDKLYHPTGMPFNEEELANYEAFDNSGGKFGKFFDPKRTYASKTSNGDLGMTGDENGGDVKHREKRAEYAKQALAHDQAINRSDFESGESPDSQRERGMFPATDPDLGYPITSHYELRDDYEELQIETYYNDIDTRLAAKGYMGTSYDLINGYLRENDGNMDAEASMSSTPEQILRLDALMAKQPTKRPMATHRIVGPGFPIDELSEGDEYVDHGFLSTTANRDKINALSYLAGVPRDQATTMEIRVPEGTEAFYATGFNTLTEARDRAPDSHTGEAELILARGLTYRVVSKQGTHVIVEVVPSTT